MEQLKRALADNGFEFRQECLGGNIKGLVVRGQYGQFADDEFVITDRYPMTGEEGFFVTDELSGFTHQFRTVVGKTENDVVLAS